MVQLPGTDDQDVGHRHAAHGHDADRPGGLLRHGSGAPQAEPLRQEAGADERDGRRSTRKSLPCRLRRGSVGHVLCRGEERAEAIGNRAVLGGHLGVQDLCLPPGCMQQGRRVTTDGPDRSVVAEQQRRDLPGAGNPCPLGPGGVRRRRPKEKAGRPVQLAGCRHRVGHRGNEQQGGRGGQRQQAVEG